MPNPARNDSEPPAANSEGSDRVLLLDAVPPDPLVAMLKTQASEGRTAVVGLSDASARAATKLGLPCKSFLEYLDKDDWEHIDREVVQWYKQIPETPVAETKSLKEVLWCDGASFWWFVEQYLFFEGGLFDIVKHVHSVKTILKRERPREVVGCGDNRWLRTVIEHFAAEQCIEVRWLEAEHSSSNTTRRDMRPKIASWMRSLYYSFEFFSPVRLLLSLWFALRRLLGRYRPAPGQILILSRVPYAWRVIHDPATGEERRADLYWDAVEQELSRHHPEKNLLHIAIRTNRTQDTGLLGQLRYCVRLLSAAPQYVPLEYYMTFTAARKINRLRRELLNRWQSLVSGGVAPKLFHYEGIDFSALFERRLFPGLNGIFSRASKRFILMKEVIDREKPGVTALHGEVQCVGRALIAACQAGGIPTVGLQHGCMSVFPSDGFMYHHKSLQETSHESHPNPLGCPIATRTAVWGRYFEKLYERNHYPPNSVEVTGNPRYDLLAKTDQYDRDAVRKRLGLESGLFTILFASSSATYRSEFQPTDNNVIHLNAVLQSFYQLEGIQLIIKLHPVDNPSIYGPDLRRKWQHPRITVVTNEDVLALISLSDLLVCRYSGTILEAAAFGVPSINLNLINIPDNLEFVGEGGAFGVTREEDLVPAIRQFMEGSDLARQLAERREHFLDEWIHNRDGHAAYRVMNLMVRLSEQRVSDPRSGVQKESPST